MTVHELTARCLVQIDEGRIPSAVDLLELVAAAKAEGAAGAGNAVESELSDRDQVRLQRAHDRMQNAIERAIRACPDCLKHTCNRFAHDWLKAAAWPERNFPWLETPELPVADVDLLEAANDLYGPSAAYPEPPRPSAPAALPVPAGPTRKRMPPDRKGVTHKFNIAGCDGYLTVGLYEDGTVGEIFLRMAKQGSTLSGLVDSWAVCFSMALQYGVPLEKLCEKFKAWSFDPAGYTGNKDIPRAESIVDYVSRWLLLYTGHPSMLPAEDLAVSSEPPDSDTRAGEFASSEAATRAGSPASPEPPARLKKP